MTEKEYGQEKIYRLNLHTHTTDSDGKKSPEEVVELYRNAGYDAIAITDHWVVGEERKINGFPVIAGCEYNFGGGNADGGQVYHIVALGYHKDPGVTREDSIPVCIGKIHEAGGLAVLAHPAWSLNQPDDVAGFDGFDATEIFNTVSGEGQSNRPYSGAFVDLMAARGKCFPLIAADDAHYYGEEAGRNDSRVAAICVALPHLAGAELVRAVRAGNFCATVGGVGAPEVRLTIDGDRAELICSPASKIDLYSNIVWYRGHHLVGENLTSHHYRLHPKERYLRAEVTDREGRTTYTGFVLSGNVVDDRTLQN